MNRTLIQLENEARAFERRAQHNDAPGGEKLVAEALAFAAIIRAEIARRSPGYVERQRDMARRSWERELAGRYQADPVEIEHQHGVDDDAAPMLVAA